MATHSWCSCLENPRDGGAWWAAVYGVTQSQTGLSDLAATAAEGKISNVQTAFIWEGWQRCFDNSIKFPKAGWEESAKIKSISVSYSYYNKLPQTVA